MRGAPKFIRTSPQAMLLLRHIVTGSLASTPTVRSLPIPGGSTAMGSLGFVHCVCKQTSGLRMSREGSGKGTFCSAVRPKGISPLLRPTQPRNAVAMSMSSSQEGTGASPVQKVQVGQVEGYTIWEEQADFSSLGLQEPVVKALKNLGFVTPTKIQAATIPQILAGKDVVMGAETGSGKTFSYGLPAISVALDRKAEWDEKPEALVLVPNQELARQVALVLTSLGREDPELAVPITILAGSSGFVRGEPSAIYIGTPSAILRLTEPWQLDQVSLVVVDEADMLLDGGYVADLTKILSVLVPTVSQAQKRRLHREGKTIDDADLPRQPAQTVFAAATLPDWKGDKVKSVVRDIQKRFPNARHVSTAALHYQSNSAEHTWVDARGQDRHEILLQVLSEHAGERTMVFAGSVAACVEAEQVLADAGLNPLAIHKEVAPTERAEVLAVFKEEPGRVLVCTDLVARGVDIPNVQHVVQLDFAASAMMHLHRVGRTARAGGKGHVTNILDELSWAMGETVRAEAGQGAALAPVFSRNRGFRRRLKRHGTGVAGRAPSQPAEKLED